MHQFQWLTPVVIRWVLNDKLLVEHLKALAGEHESSEHIVASIVVKVKPCGCLVFKSLAGYLFHIDFGFVLGDDPKPLSPPVRLPAQIAQALIASKRLNKCFLVI